MKILFLIPSLSSIGGIQNYSRNLISALEKNGESVSLVERNTGGFLAKVIFFIRAVQYVFWTRPDFIVCTHLHFSPLCFWFKKIFGIEYSVSVYGIEIENIQSKSFKQALISAKHIIYLFEKTAQNLIFQIPAVRQKMFNIQNSIDGEVFKIKEKPKDLISRFDLMGSKVILTIGRMSKLDGDNKGYRRVVKAMKEILIAVPEAKYLLVGGGDDVDGVKELVIKEGLEKEVILVNSPTNDELVEYYNLVDVFVLPSKNEGFPSIVLLEALACGVPVVVGNQVGAEELVSNKLGEVVPSDDVSAISKAIVRLLKNKPSNSGILNRKMISEYTLTRFGRSAYEERVKQFVNLIK